MAVVRGVGIRGALARGSRDGRDELVVELELLWRNVILLRGNPQFLSGVSYMMPRILHRVWGHWRAQRIVSC